MRKKSMDIICDAPRYEVVRACRFVGIQTPEDVVWREVHRYLQESGHPGMRAGKTWREVINGDGPPARCTCGTELPWLVEYEFELPDGASVTHPVAQCQSCHAIYWQEL
jgi:hypothetical protein